MSRLAQGGLIDRTRRYAFTFDGKAFSGFAGDTLASALVANDIKLVGRSFKYHRPRGILTAGPEEPNALVTLGAGAAAEPNCRATMVPLFDGLQASSQNRWPSLSCDILAINQLFSPILVAGFYYKTFMWPSRFWEKLYEPLIRRAAGLGALTPAPDPDRYDRAHGFCDLLVIGGGPAGLAAALTAGRAGLRVILADMDRLWGGRLLAEHQLIGGQEGHQWASTVAEELAALPNVTLLPRTLIFGIYDGREYAAVQHLADDQAAAPAGRPRQRFWKIIARHAVLASGAIERPLVFGGNDRPGVMTASALSTYVNRFAAVPGKRVVLFTTSDSGWTSAFDLIAAGIEVAAVVEARPDLPALADRVRRAGIEILAGAVVTDVRGRSVGSVEIVTQHGGRRRIAADVLAVAGGWNPNIGLGGNLGGRPVWSDSIHSYVLDESPPGLQPIGAAAGRFALSDALADGLRAGSEVAAALGVTAAAADLPACSDDAVALAPIWQVRGAKGKAFVDFQHDVTDEDIALAAREGFRSVELMKRYTTLGMATDQGKTSQVNAHGLLAAATGRKIADIGTILSRPPVLPVAIGVLAGAHRDQHFRPERHTASHQWAAEQGASFVDAGLWKRAQCYARPGDKDWRETVNREVTTTRTGVGFCDISTLGKIELQGPDAAILLDRLYINSFSTLAVGRARYGVMLREDGFVMDDGTTTRFAEDRFFLTTTTVNAAKVMQHIDYARQVLWPELDVQAVSVTEQWASFSVAGPRARDLLQQILPDKDLSNDAVPFMAARECHWQGVPAKLFRLSFSGELAFEISVWASHGDRLARALSEAGRAFGATPYGTEALGVMRIEKGHPAGNELNGQTTAPDLGLGRMMSKKKDFIGRVMAMRPGLTDPARPALVGLRPVASGERIRAGGHLLEKHAKAIAANDQGHVTSAAFSPTLGHWIGLALLRHGPERHGEQIVIHDPLRGADIAAQVCSPRFVDPEGVRVRG